MEQEEKYTNELSEEYRQNYNNLENTGRRISTVMLLVGILVVLIYYLFLRDKFPSFYDYHDSNNYKIVGLYLFSCWFIRYYTRDLKKARISQLEIIDEEFKISNQAILDENGSSVYSELSTRDLIYVHSEKLYIQVGMAERKATNLLQDGKNYILFGVIFYVAAIVLWVAYSINFPINRITYFGMAGCTGIFILFEVIAAWYLKQYRYYVDKSTYLVKIKAIFDQYHICYSLAKENNFEDITYSNLFDYLSKEINWPPDNHLHKNKYDDIHESLLGTVKELTSLLKYNKK